jgi:hypothetical protein
MPDLANLAGHVARYHLVRGDGFHHRCIPSDPKTKAPPHGVTWKRYQTIDPSPDVILGWDRDFPRPPYLRSLILGRRTGLLVLDVDVRAKHERGIDAFALLEHTLGYTPPRTFTVLTASGGWHFYFLYPDFPVHNIIGKLWPAADVIAEGGNIIAPGSVRNGSAYEIAIDRPVAPLPGWLRQAIITHQQRQRTPSPTLNRDARPAWTDALTPVPQGRQDDCLIALAGKLARDLPEESWPAIATTLAGAAAQYPQDPAHPYTGTDFERIANSATQMERARRQTIRPIVFHTIL